MTAAESDSRRLGLLLLLSILLTTLASIAVVPWYYGRQREAIETATSVQLRAIADSEAEQIANWRTERLGDGAVLASGSLVRSAKRVLTSANADSERGDLLDVFRSMEASFLYTGAALVDVDGRATVESLGGVHASAALWGGFIGGTEAVSLSDLYRDPTSKRVLMALVAPVDALGAFVLEIDASRFLFPYLAARTRSRTGETYLVRADGLYLSALRDAPGDALVKRFPDPAEWAALAGAARDDRVLRWRDYRGIPVIGAIRAVANAPWYLVTTIDADEVYAPLRRLAWDIGIVVALIALANAAGVGWVWRNKQLRTHREREERFRAIANDTPAYIWMTDAVHHNSFINAPMKRFFGVDQDALGTTWADFVHPEDREHALAVFEEALAARVTYRNEFRMRRFDGQYRWMLSDGVPRYSGDGGFLGYAGAQVDITERRQAEQALRDANVVLGRELEERKRTEQQVHMLTGRLLHAQEEERTRIARELHDDLSQEIAAVSIALSNLKHELAADADAAAEAERIRSRLSTCAEKIRRLSHQLHPTTLSHLGLAQALRSHAEEVTRLTTVQVAVTCDGSFDDLPASTVLSLFRITQEALRNVARHAEASHASVSLVRRADAVRLAIEDDGKGIDRAHTDRPFGLGLVSICERARSLNGRCDIDSVPGQGTRVVVDVPEHDVDRRATSGP